MAITIRLGMPDFVAFAMMMLYLAVALELVLVFVPLPYGSAGPIVGGIAFAVAAPVVFYVRNTILTRLEARR